jgi:hypothetical protein
MVATQPDILMRREWSAYSQTPAGTPSFTRSPPMPGRNAGSFRREAPFVKEDEALRVDLFAFFP